VKYAKKRHKNIDILIVVYRQRYAARQTRLRTFLVLNESSPEFIFSIDCSGIHCTKPSGRCMQNHLVKYTIHESISLYWNNIGSSRYEKASREPSSTIVVWHTARFFCFQIIVSRRKDIKANFVGIIINNFSRACDEKKIDSYKNVLHKIKCCKLVKRKRCIKKIFLLE